ncbi:MFS transporter [Pseudosporangium ferrugineum]|uniref:EmrB/QacA subfamily drug resistance transporter n=1 Tax=Pseudosporangium ferrugineum TaxID=439699 RepID=A0A2T0SJ80_9ACTN|nr:MFS transporter [Pseudosporangium ferrugineum]PRY33461.1 EmrB/QacA subfamily drug resistance transporter [Pseudosporangium ferrugineum]
MTNSATRRALTALSLSMLLPSLGTSVANVGLPAIAAGLGAGFGTVQWVVLGYLLAVTTLIVGAGRLGDLIGRRRLLLGSIALFTGATLLCGLAPGTTVLIAARVLQGAGAAGMMALTTALVGESVPADRTGSAMGLLGSVSAVGTALGPSLGGALVAGFGWRAIFLAVVPLGLAALVLAVRALPRPAPAARAGGRRFDPVGTALLAVTLGAYALATTAGTGAVGLLAVAAAGLVLFVIAENRVASPLLSPRVVREPGLAAGLATSALVSTVMMTTLVVGPFHLAGALGLGPAAAGLVMSAGPAVAALAGVPAGRAADRWGTRATVVTGLAAIAGGAVALAVLPVSAGVPGYLLPLLVVTAGYAVFQAANNTAVLRDVAPRRRGLVSGMLHLSRNVGLMTGASVMGAVFAYAGPGGSAVAPPAVIARGTHAAFAVAALLVGAGLVLALTRRPAAAVTPSPVS